jgi:mono/diheme cytochrome c family protein
VQANFGLARKSADTPEGHKAALALVAAFKDAEEFWAGRKVTQAAEWSKQAMGHAQALEKAIAAKDAAAGAEAGKLLGGTCQTCHTQYREKTAEGGFRIKAQ